MAEKTTEPDARASLEVTLPLSGEIIAVPRADDEGVPRRFATFEHVELVGQGGMASVYRAYDTKLHRTVALKFLRESDPATKARLLNEARAQARVDDTRICAVYAVDELEGRAYVVMQYIHGQTLAEAALQMTLEEKLRVMHEVAEAIHSAHRAGLIHRDLKSTNIMVERSDDGEWLPYVLDFGLARDTASATASTTSVVGTPSYMAPEQVRGERLAIDRRTDIWSLGVTLYEMVSGELPFQAANTFAVLAEIVQKDAVSLRARVPTIPADVNTIVMKCLEKDPARRYESARALAEDIARYLDGEPILAKRASAWQRFTRAARQHRAVLTTAAIALVVLIGFGVFALRQRLVLREQAEVGQRLAGEIAQMESNLRLAAMLPAHDIRRDKASARARIATIEQERRRMSEATAAAARYAIGRAYLALGEIDRARTNLQEAWNDGYRTRAAAYSLGLAEAALFETKLDQTRFFRAELREARQKALEREHRDRAVELLRRARGTGVAEYTEALLAQLQGRYAEALAKADAALAAVPWLYEAERLKGSVHRAIAHGHRDAGNYAAADQAFARAAESYARALRIAESDVESHLGAGRGVHEQIWMRRLATNPIDDLAELAFSHARAAAAIDPTIAAPHVLRSATARLVGETQSSHGRDPTAALREAVSAADHALQLEPQSTPAHIARGAALIQQATYAAQRGDDGMPALRAAAAALRRALQLQPNEPDAQTYLGNVLLTQALYTTDGDVRPLLRDAISQYEAVLRIAPTHLSSLNNVGICYTQLAQKQRESGESPEQSLQTSIGIFHRLAKLNPNLPVVYNNVGLNHWELAEYLDETGRDPMPRFREAIAAFDRSIAQKGDYLPYFNATMVYALMALREADYGRDPSEFLAMGEKRFAEGLRQNARIAAAYPFGALLDYVRGRWLMRQGRSPEGAIARGIQRTADGAAVAPTYPLLYTTRAMFLMLRGEHRARSGESADHAFAEAEAAIRRALAISPKDGDNLSVAAELYAKWAEWRISRKMSAERELKLAIDYGEQAVAAGPRTPRMHIVRGRALLAQAQATGDAHTAARAAAAFDTAFQLDADQPPEIHALREKARGVVR